MSDFKTTYETGQNNGIASLSASGSAAATTAPCEREDIIPIYPVRIGWGDLKGDVNGGFTYPASLAPFASPSSPASTGGFALRQLRGGHVMIYDVKERTWSIFSYARNATPAGGSFTHWTWKPGDTDWHQSGAATPIAFVPDSATEIYICFIEHLWSRATFQRAHNNENGFRDKVMRRVTLTAPSAATFSAPLSELAQKVEEFSPNGLVQPHEDWRVLSETPGAKIDPAAILNVPMAKGNKVAPVMIALHDPAGVVLEMAMSHANRMAIRAQYLEVNAYALTTARATQVMQNYAKQQLLDPRLSYFKKYALEKWGDAIRPERDSFLIEAEETLKNFEATIKGPLDAWQKYFEMGLRSPDATPGSLQTHLLNFDRTPTDGRDVAGLARFAHDCVATIIGSQAGQQRVSKVLMAPDRWTEQLNPVKAFMQIVGAGLTSVKEYASYRTSITQAADELLRDISLPMAFEITKLGREELLKDVNIVGKHIHNRTVTRVFVNVDDAMNEINRRPRETSSTDNLNRSHRVHRVQTPLGLYKYDGIVHVAGPDGVATVGAVASGFGILANSLNMMELMAATERSKLSGMAGAIGSNPYLGLTLTTIDTMNQLFEFTSKLAARAGMGEARGYQISGKLSRAQLTALMKGKTVTQDLVKTVVARGGEAPPVTRVAAAPRTMMATVGVKVLSGAGIALGLLDLFNAAESFRRGDNIGTMSNIALGVGAILMAWGGFVGLSTGASVVGAIAGLILVILGAVLSFFVDDPVTSWLKNGYWGTSRSYLYWRDTSRVAFSAASGSAHLGQRDYIVQKKADFDFPKYFAREMQQFNEFVYWPQNSPDPAAITSNDRNWLGIKIRTAAPVRAYSVSFRLPNYIPGYSVFTGKIMAVVFADSPRLRQSASSRWDVSDQFWESATYTQGDIVTGSFFLRVPENQNASTYDDINWELLRVELDKGWLYTPLPGLVLPRKYKDHFFGGEWDDKGSGEGDAIVISGSA